MPYEMKKEGNGYVVISKETGNAHSHHPLKKAVAEAQMRALYAAAKRNGEMMPKKK